MGSFGFATGSLPFASGKFIFGAGKNFFAGGKSGGLAGPASPRPCDRLDNDGYQALWDVAHPDDPLEVQGRTTGEVNLMSETIDAATWLVFLTKVLSDETKREEVIARIAELSGVEPQDVAKILYAARDVLAEDLPFH